MSAIRLAIAAAVVVVAMARPASAAQMPGGSVIRGTIADASGGAAVGDARVVILELNRSITTSADGRFEFRDVAAGTYTLTVSRIGYIFVRRKIELLAEAVVDLAIPIAGGTGTYQETVNVAAETMQKSDVGVSSQADLGSAALQALRGVAADDPLRAMQALPGVATGDDFQAQFSMRGSAFRQVGIVIDGIATPMLLHAVRGVDDTGSIAMINSDVLSHASLESGAYPQRHGGWLVGTLDFDMREGSRDRLAARLAVSGTSASTVVEGPLGTGKRGSWLLSLRRSYIDWLIRKIEPSIDDTLGFSDLMGKAVYDLTSRQQLQFLVVGGTATYKQLEASGINQLAKALSKSGLAALSWRYARNSVVFSQRFSFAENNFHDWGSVHQEQASGVSQSFVWRGDATWAIRPTLSFEAGLRGEMQRTQQRFRTFQQTNQGLRVRAERALPANTRIPSGWAQLARRTPLTGLAGGVRMTHDTFGDSTTASGWVLGERHFGSLTFRAGVAGSAQIPDLEFRIAVLPTQPSMRPEQAISIDAGVEHRLSKSITWTVTGFHRSDSNVMRRLGEDKLVNGVRVAETTFQLYGTQLEGPTNGADVTVMRRATSGPTGWIGYTYEHTRYHDTVTGESFDADNDQRHTLNIFLEQRLSYRFAASLKWRLGSNFPIVGYFTGTPPDQMKLSSERNLVRLPHYSRLDLRLNRTFTFNRSRLTLFVEVMNATGHENLGQADGTIRTNLDATGWAERLIPRVPSAGILIEF